MTEHDPERPVQDKPSTATRSEGRVAPAARALARRAHDVVMMRDDNQDERSMTWPWLRTTDGYAVLAAKVLAVSALTSSWLCVKAITQFVGEWAWWTLRGARWIEARTGRVGTTLARGPRWVLDKARQVDAITDDALDYQLVPPDQTCWPTMGRHLIHDTTQQRVNGWSAAISRALDDDQLASAVSRVTNHVAGDQLRVPILRAQLITWASSAHEARAGEPLDVALRDALRDARPTLAVDADHLSAPPVDEHGTDDLARRILGLLVHDPGLRRHHGRSSTRELRQEDPGVDRGPGLDR